MKKLLPVLLLLAGSACQKELVCPAGETGCDGHCVSLLTDQANCGACGRPVGALEICAAATATCAPGIESCGGPCTDLARDAANCGACGVACDPEQLCATEASGTSCVDACPVGFTACGRSCVHLDSDRFHCGACGHACASGESCRTGACRADLFVACYATSEVIPVTTDLAPAGGSRPTAGGPTAMALADSAVYSANGWPGSVSVLPLDPSLPARDVIVTGSNDLEHVAVLENVVVASVSDLGTLLFLSPGGGVLDEVAMPRQNTGPYPLGFAAAGTIAYVALSGSGPASGQSVATVELSGLAACAAIPGAGGCGSVTGEVDLLTVPGTSDAPGLPFPSHVIEAGGRILVSLSNLAEDTTPYGNAWVKPAGNGKLAVIDPSAGNAISIVDLGMGCGNPGSLALDGSTLWVACGSWGYPALAPGALVPVDLSKAPPLAGEPLAFGAILPGKVAFCGGLGYVTDQWSGSVVRFDPATRAVEAPVVVCPTTAGPYGWSWASDVTCAR